MRPTIVCCLLIYASIFQSQGATQQDKSATQTQNVPRITVKGDVMKKKLVHRVMPNYPLEARHESIAGIVKLHVLIGVDGSVKEAEFISGPDVLVKPTLDAVRKWKYKPTTENGQPVEVDTTVETVFSIVH